MKNKTARDVLVKLAVDYVESKNWRDEADAVDKALKELRRILPKKQPVEYGDEEYPAGYNACRKEVFRRMR